MPLSKKFLWFLKILDLKVDLPTEVEVMNPFKDQATFNLCEKFYKKYYSDDNPRYLILGINPGRFGGGVTGIPFTDPVRLQNTCGIENDFQKKTRAEFRFYLRNDQCIWRAGNILWQILYFCNQSAGFYKE